MVLPVGDVNPTRRVPVVTLTLIAINIVVYLLVQPHVGGPFGGDASNLTQREAVTAICETEAFYYRWAAVPEEIVDLRPLTDAQLDRALGPCRAFGHVGASKRVVISLITAMFLHAGLAHLLGNLLFLWVFGNNVEDRLGRGRFLAFYLVGGAAATYVFALLNRTSILPLLGASGAIAAVLGAYLLMFPRARVRVYAPFPLYFLAPLFGGRVVLWLALFAIVELPAFLVLVGWFGLQLVASAQPALEAGVAFEAHTAGFAAGMVLTLLLDPQRR